MDLPLRDSPELLLTEVLTTNNVLLLLAQVGHAVFSPGLKDLCLSG